jgi:hypothetical protein
VLSGLGGSNPSLSASFNSDQVGSSFAKSFFSEGNATISASTSGMSVSPSLSTFNPDLSEFGEASGEGKKAFNFTTSA